VVENSKIEWTNHSFSAWVGCQAVSPACDHCYAEAQVRRYGKDFAKRTRTTRAYWRQPLKWNRDALASGKRTMVFCASMADVFDNQVPVEWRSDLFHLIDITPALTWQLLTKRPQNIATMMPPGPAVRKNVWLGATAENQEETTRRMPHLRANPATVRFLSCEPLLGPIRVPDGVDWVICGGESGPRKRPLSLTAARDIRDQCAERKIPFFFKQVDKVIQIPPDLMVRQFPGDPM
jgi:protein gp37